MVGDEKELTKDCKVWHHLAGFIRFHKQKLRKLEELLDIGAAISVLILQMNSQV
jgi:hypothetical protein